MTIMNTVYKTVKGEFYYSHLYVDKENRLLASLV